MTKAVAKPRGSRKSQTSDDERLRRTRLGELRRLFRDRYHSAILPDDDSGHGDLRELLLLASMAFNPERSMKSMFFQHAPWMSPEVVQQFIDDVKQTPVYLRKPSARILGDRLRLTSEERHRLAIRTIKPFDRTDAELKADRKAKDNARKWRKRRAGGKKDRQAWLRNCKSQLKPWVRAKMSKRTWYRRQAERRAKERTEVAQVVGTGVSAVKINTVEDRPVPS